MPNMSQARLLNIVLVIGAIALLMIVAGVDQIIALLIPVALFGIVILGIASAVCRPKARECPACGMVIQRGPTSCPHCGFDFAAAARRR